MIEANSISVLVTAEIVAQVYYPALREATDAAILQCICDQIIRDELPHVQFQCQRLAILRADRGRLGLALTSALQRFLMFGTAFVVWWGHGKAFRAGGYGFRRYWRELWQHYKKARRVMSSRAVNDE